MDAKSPKDLHFYEPRSGHGLKHDPFNAIVAAPPRYRVNSTIIGVFISTCLALSAAHSPARKPPRHTDRRKNPVFRWLCHILAPCGRSHYFGSGERRCWMDRQPGEIGDFRADNRASGRAAGASVTPWGTILPVIRQHLRLPGCRDLSVKGMEPINLKNVPFTTYDLRFDSQNGRGADALCPGCERNRMR